MRIRVGQRLKVRTFKDKPKHWMKEMEPCMGKIATITAFFPDRIEPEDLPYRINLDDGMWGWISTDFESNNKWEGGKR